MITQETKIRNVQVIVNPVAGKKNPGALPLIRDAMKAAGLDWGLGTTQRTGDGIEFARSAIRKGADVVAVFGGDGTVTDVANGLVGSGVPMLILPGGSANVMAKELGIPLDVGAACALLSEQRHEMREIDAVRFHKGYFVGRASMGFEADMVRGADRQTKNRLGCLAYLVAALRAVKTMRLAEYSITIDGVERRVRGVTCIVTNAGNVGFSSRISLDRRVDVSDGLLDVLVVKRANLSLVGHALKTLWRGERPDNWDVVAHWQGQEIEVVSRPRQHVECDGEIFGKSALRASVMPGALRVLVPKRGDPPYSDAAA